MIGGSIVKYVVVALLAVLVTTNVVTGINSYRLRSEIAALSVDKETLQEEVRLLKSDRDMLKSELGRRADIIENLRTFFKDYDSAAAAKQEEIAIALQKVSEIVKQTNARSQRILADLPQSEDVCTEANRLINQYLSEVYGVQ